MTILWYGLAILILIVAVIGVHEWGHFIVAKFMGVPALTFSLGFGKPLLSHTSRDGVEYRLSMLPLGGYVKLLDEQQAIKKDWPLERCFERQPPWRRMLILIAGPLANVIFAVIAFFLMLMIGVSSYKPMVTEVKVDSLAAQAGLLPGDQILSIDRWETPNWGSVLMSLIYYVGDSGELTISVKRQTAEVKKLSLSLSDWRLDPLKPDILASLGIKAAVNGDDNTLRYVLKKPMKEAFLEGMMYTWRYLLMDCVVFAKLLTGKISLQSLAGPLAMFQIAGLSLGLGLAHFLEFLAIISVAVALVNIFPIPGLDGGQLLYLLVEKVRGQPVSMDVQLLALRLSTIVLSVLFIQLVLNDLQRILS